MNELQRPVGGAPLWSRSRPRELGPPLSGPVRADVAVVGAGITGLTLALLLQREGLSVVLLEAARVASGTSGATSAHVTSVLDISYRQLLDRLGHERATAVVEGSGRALDFIRSLGTSSLACSFETCPAYRYTEDADAIPELQKEFDAARELGVPVSLTDGSPLPFPVARALHFSRQGAFDPVEYLVGLAELFVAAGGRLHERARVTEFEEDSDSVVLQATGGLVVASHAVLATHTPIATNLVQSQTEPHRSYLLALRTTSELAAGLYWDSETPYHYLRPVRWNGASLVLVGGEDHRVGHDDAHERYQALERYARDRFGDLEVVRRWSAQLYEPADGLPFVGRSPLAERIYVATGFAGTGLVLGTLAAHVVADALRGRPDTPLAEVVRATRAPALAAAGRVTRQGLDTAVRYIGDRLGSGDVGSVAEIPKAAGAIVEVEGQKLAVYRDVGGRLHAISPVCTHMGCIVRWNGAERSWDCPCHGGRFSALGEVQSGPPMRDLEGRGLPREAL